MGGRVRLTFELEDADKVALFVWGIKFDADRWEFSRWQSDATFPGEVFLAPIRWNGLDVLFLGILVQQPVENKTIIIGGAELRFLGGRGSALTADDLRPVFGQVLTVDGDIRRPRGIPEDELPKQIVFGDHLRQNYPNPFNPVTTIEFSIAKATPVDLSIYNVRGQLVRTLMHARLKPNTYKATWDGRNSHGAQVASGAYFLRLSTQSFIKTKKMLLLK